MKLSICRAIHILAILFFMNCAVHAQFGKLDKSILVELNEDRSPGRTNFFKGVSNTTGIISVGIPVALLVAGEIKGDKPLKQKALFIGESIVVSSVVTWGLKYSVKRLRPATSYPGEIIPAGTGGSPSFPSGHTSQAFATATALYMSWPKWYVGVPALAWASTVGYSRMYLGVHYPTDVVAGALVGIGSAWLTQKGNEWINRRRQVKNLMIALY